MKGLLMEFLLAIAAPVAVAIYLVHRINQAGSPNNLPHRPLSQIDIQGHQVAGTAPAVDPCPGQYGYYLYNPRMADVGPNETIVYCWGTKQTSVGGVP